jgi:hypothetical protein
MRDERNELYTLIKNMKSKHDRLAKITITAADISNKSSESSEVLEDENEEV